jgi:hypothetical protein
VSAVSRAASTPSGGELCGEVGVAGGALEQGEVEETVGVIDLVAGPHDVLVHGGEEPSARGGEVEPLRVVDRDDHGPGLRLEPQGVQHGAPAGERVVVPEQRLRVEVDVLEQVDQPAERQGHLLLRGPRHEHVKARGPAAAERGSPQRRLADSRLASDDERRCSLG